METTATIVGTATVSIAVTANAVSTACVSITTTQPVAIDSFTDWLAAVSNALIFLGALVGGAFAYWRHRVAALDRLVELFDRESHGVRLWNLSAVIRGGGVDALATVYDPGGRRLSPRAWRVHRDDDDWAVIGPSLSRTTRVWDEPYRSLFAEGFGPGHSPDGTKAEFDRFAWLVRRIAVASGFESASPVDWVMRRWLVRHLAKSTAARIPDAMLHFEVVVSRLVRFFDQADEPDSWTVDGDYFWHSYGLDDPLYTSFRAYLKETGVLVSDGALESWTQSARRGGRFTRVPKNSFRRWVREFEQLDDHLHEIPYM